MMHLLATLTGHLTAKPAGNAPTAPAPPLEDAAYADTVTRGIEACATVLGMVFLLLEHQAASARRTHQLAHLDQAWEQIEAALRWEEGAGQE